MYVVGGFDGSRLNDMFHIALDKSKGSSSGSLSHRSSSDESVVSYKSRPPTSAASGIMQTVPSDLSINQVSYSELEIDVDESDQMKKWSNNGFLRKKIQLL